MGGDKIRELSLLWFDYILKEKENKIQKMPDVELFIMGDDQWKKFNTFPPKNMYYEKWYFGSDNGANSLSGDGFLSQKLIEATSIDTFTFDPYKPVPTNGGANFHFMLDTIGIRDQRDIEIRDDVLVYTSEILGNNIEIIGHIHVNLFASSSAEDTDFTAKLVEVYKDGYARNIEEGIIRASNRNSLINRELIKPDKIYEFTINLGYTGISIQKGSRLRLEISSSNFPKYVRNSNSREDSYTAKKLACAKQKKTRRKNYEKLFQYFFFIANIIIDIHLC